MKNSLQNFLDTDGQLIQWPSKRANKLLALEYLAQKFQAKRIYTEREVNDILRQWHTFEDWATDSPRPRRLWVYGTKNRR